MIRRLSVYLVSLLIICVLLTICLQAQGSPNKDAFKIRGIEASSLQDVGPHPSREKMSSQEATIGHQTLEPGRPAIYEQAFDSLIAKAQTNGSVMVIVGLRVPFQAEGKFASQADVRSQRNSIALYQDLLLEQMVGYRVTTMKRFDYIPFIAMEVDTSALEFLRNSAEVSSVQEDQLLDLLLDRSVPLIGGPSAWARGYSGVGQTIAIIDSGVDKTHPFLSGKVVSEACYSTTSVANSLTSVCPGGVSESTSPGSGMYCTMSDCIHGTHVAGIAAGKGEIFSGVAKDANLISVQVASRLASLIGCGFRSFSCTVPLMSDVLKGLERVYQLRSTYNIAAVNISIGGGQYFSNCDDYQPPFKAAIDNLRSTNIATIIASGNQGYTNALSAPACISSAVSVGSTDDGSGGTFQDSVSLWGDGGSNSAYFLKLLAPGQLITSSIPAGQYAPLAGTSMAAPHVAGSWAVLKSKSPNASVDQILSALISTGLPIADFRNGITKPRIRLDAAIDALSGPDTTPPTVTITSPTTGPTFTTSNSPLTLGGTASDNVGVAQVTWANNRGGSGVALGASSWTASGVSLQSGTNVITVTARDASGNTGVDALTVTYTPPGCTYSISPTSRTHGSGMETGGVSVTTGSGCSWTSASYASWITFNSGSSGTGSGTVGYSVLANTNTSLRTSYLTIAGQSFTVTQQGIPVGPTSLVSGIPVYGGIPSNPSTTACTLAQSQYSINVPSNALQLIVSLTGNQDVDLFLRYGQPVSQAADNTSADFRAETTLPNETIYLGPQSTPALLAGTYYIAVGNCPSSQASFSLTAMVISSSSPLKTEEVAIDDGTVETGLLDDGVIVVNRLTPPRYPSKLKAIRIDVEAFKDQPDPVNKQIRLIAFADTAGLGRPPSNPLRLVDQMVAINGEYGYIDFAIPNGATINSGDWYIGFQYPNPGNGVLAAADSNGTQRQRSFYSTDNGANFDGPLVLTPNTQVNLMIRAVVESGIPANLDTPIISAASANYLSDGTIGVSISGQDQGGNVTTINETRFDAGGQVLGVGNFDISDETSGRTSFSLGFTIAGGNRLADTKQIQFKLVDGNGFNSNVMTASLSGGGRNVTVLGGGAATLATSGTNSIVRAGYSTVGTNSGTTPYGTAVFSVTQNGFVVSEAGVPSSPPTTSARIFIDYRKQFPAKSGNENMGTIDINTGFAIVNRGAGIANITYQLNNYDGSNLATGHGTLNPNVHKALFITELSQIAPDFVLPSLPPATIGWASLNISSNQPLSVVALRLTTNQRGETLLTTTPVADLTKSLGTGPLFFPQLADGGGFTTSIVLMNTSNQVETGALRIFNNSGAPLGVRQFGDTGSYATFTYNIKPGGHVGLLTDGSPGVINAGSVQITPDPGTYTPVGAGVFSYSPSGTLVTESGIPSATPTTHARIYLDRSGGHNSGLAIAAPNGTALGLTLNAYRSDGLTFVGSGSLNITGNGHDAKFANEFIPSLPVDFTGVLDISSSSPFVALTLRSLTNSRGDFLMTTFPIADFNQLAPSPIVFPQIADGGGYKTQLILLSTTGGASTTVNFFDDFGSPLQLGKSANEERTGQDSISR